MIMNDIIDKIKFYEEDGTPYINDYIKSLYDDIEDGDIFLTAVELLNDIMQEEGADEEEVNDIISKIRNSFLS